MGTLCLHVGSLEEDASPRRHVGCECVTSVNHTEISDKPK